MTHRNQAGSRRSARSLLAAVARVASEAACAAKRSSEPGRNDHLVRVTRWSSSLKVVLVAALDALVCFCGHGAILDAEEPVFAGAKRRDRLECEVEGARRSWG